jgi:tetratricopeptide (TPR) repeat protein
MSTDPAKLEFLLNQTFNQTRGWLDPSPMLPVALRQSSRLLIGQLKEALGRGNRGEIRWFMDRLTDLSDKIQHSSSLEPREPSVIKIECALAAYQMQNYVQAVEFLESAMKVFKDGYALHFEGVIRSTLGCIHWRSSGQQDNAIVCWEQSIEIYRGLKQRRDGMARSGWYDDRIDEINSILELALELSGTPFPSAPDVERPAAAAATSDVSSTLTGDMLRLFSVVEEVQAGSFGAVGVDPNVFLGYVEMSQCHIGGVAHYVMNLRGKERAIRIPWDKIYRVVKVKGDSMNACGIDDGDYVLLRPQTDANDGDIVASQITKDEEPEATLKLFLRRGSEIILRFCSHNPAHKEDDGRDKEYHFSRYNDEEFQIVGVALAVFKPLNVTR